MHASTAQARFATYNAILFSRGAEAGHLERWLALGRHGEMSWLEREPERRSDPGRVVEGARAVISVGMSYYGGELQEPSDGRPRGRIARYALGDDYHAGRASVLRAIDYSDVVWSFKDGLVATPCSRAVYADELSKNAYYGALKGQ